MYQKTTFYWHSQRLKKKSMRTQAEKLKQEKLYFQAKKVEGNIDTKFKIGYEFKYKDIVRFFIKIAHMSYKLEIR